MAAITRGKFLGFHTSLVLILTLTRTSTVAGKTCEKVDICTCKLENGNKVSLWSVDGGPNAPSFTNIPQEKTKTALYNTFDWNPCTPFTKMPGCADVLVCQHSEIYYTAGTTNTSFTVDTDGSVIVTYGSSKKGDRTRQTLITLRCEKSTEGKGSIPMMYEVSNSTTSIYHGVFTSKYSCPTVTSSGHGPSVGSILLIVFFSLVLMYVVLGVVINRYGRGIQSLPEVLPNFSFWVEFPLLVKDGIIFTYVGAKRAYNRVNQKFSTSSYAEI